MKVPTASAKYLAISLLLLIGWCEPRLSRLPKAVTYVKTEVIPMLLSLRFLAVLAGAGAGSLINALLALMVGSTLSVLNVGDGASLALLPSLIIGLVTGGFIAGRMAYHTPWFHGATAGILVAAITLVTARLGGSTAGIVEVLILAVTAIFFGAIGGIVGDQRRRRR